MVSFALYLWNFQFEHVQCQGSFSSSFENQEIPERKLVSLWGEKNTRYIKYSVLFYLCLWDEFADPKQKIIFLNSETQRDLQSQFCVFFSQRKKAKKSSNIQGKYEIGPLIVHSLWPLVQEKDHKAYSPKTLIILSWHLLAIKYPRFEPLWASVLSPVKQGQQSQIQRATVRIKISNTSDNVYTQFLIIHFLESTQPKVIWNSKSLWNATNSLFC